MPDPRLLFAALALLLVSACATVQPTKAPADEFASSLDALDARLAALRESSGVPAIAVAVVAGPPGAAREIWSRAYGVLNARTGERATIDSPFMLASASKLATGIVVMQTVEAGHLQLDAPVVPAFAWGGTRDVTLDKGDGGN